MYKVFHNSSQILVGKSEEFSTNYRSEVQVLSLLDWKQILSNNSMDFKTACIVLEDSESFEDFEKSFEVKVAAGAWVFSPTEQLLMIKRNGMWDIPKGHLEQGENLEECALREVQEETGILDMSLEAYLGISRHIFPHKGIWRMKVSHWYTGVAHEEQKLIPQTDEGIEEVTWVPKEEISKHLTRGWPSLEDFYLYYLKK
jgi:8-oxo-dGTP pyrophosphatase MutT (NUDIX family)